MFTVLALAAGLWGLGALLKTPLQARLISIGLLYVAVLAIQIGFPEGHPLRVSTGGSLALWLMIGAAGVVGYAYRMVLVRLRKHANFSEQITTNNDVELERNARHIVLREIGGPGQKRLKEAKVLVIGAGGLGSPVLSYLAAAGVGTIGIIDDDVVDNSNLQRQVIHPDAAIGMPKVFSAQTAMEQQNPFVTVRPYNRRLMPDIASDLFADYDLILDGSDNFDTRYLVNETAVALGKPLIAAALTQWEGQISLYDPVGGAPCYACIFPQRPDPNLVPSCAEAGVLGPLPGVVGAMMAVEAIKEITEAGTPLRGTLLIYDALYGENRSITLKRRPDCQVCGGI